MAGLAMVYHADKRDGDALRLLDSALAMMPEISFVEKKATIFLPVGNTAKTDSLLAVIETMMNKDEAAGSINNAERALVYAKFNYKPSEALAHATKEIALRPDNITAQFAMAFWFFRTSKLAQARISPQKRYAKTLVMLICLLWQQPLSKSQGMRQRRKNTGNRWGDYKPVLHIKSVI